MFVSIGGVTHFQVARRACIAHVLLVFYEHIKYLLLERRQFNIPLTIHHHRVIWDYEECIWYLIRNSTSRKFIRYVIAWNKFVNNGICILEQFDRSHKVQQQLLSDCYMHQWVSLHLLKQADISSNFTWYLASYI